MESLHAARLERSFEFRQIQLSQVEAGSHHAIYRILYEMQR
jgi:hypothetical protein